MLCVYDHASIVEVPGGKSASWYIARFGLGQLLTDRHLASRWGPGTGAFAHDTQISYWAPPGTPPGADLLTWAAFAAREGLDASFPFARMAMAEP